jgi:hypothetical protein
MSTLGCEVDNFRPIAATSGCSSVKVNPVPRDHAQACSQTVPNCLHSFSGLWLEELAAPYYMFHDAGLKVTIASIAGGEIPVDKTSLEGDNLTPVTKKFLDDGAQAWLDS